MLVSTTLTFLAFALWTAIGLLRALVAPRARTALLRKEAWIRLQFLGGLGVFLVFEYAVYLSRAGR